MADIDEAVTAVVRPGMTRLASSKLRARKPPKPRTTTEVSLPSVIVAQELYVPPPPPSSTPTLTPHLTPLFANRAANVLFGLVAIAVSVAGLWFLPTYGALIDGALAVINQ